MRGAGQDGRTAVRTLFERPALGVGERVVRQDGDLKVKGEFAFSSDLWMEGMLWGVTVRSSHPHARITSIETGAALALASVHAVLTHEDVPGRKTYGIKRADQPVLASDRVRYQGEPVALVVADSPEAARRGARKVEVSYEPLDPVVDPELALMPDAPRVHDQGNVTASLHIRRGDVVAAAGAADVIVEGEYEIGMQDQAFLGPESGLAVPTPDGGVELYVATQNLYFDLDQMCESLALTRDQIRMTVAGVGGAFGGREDLSVQIHACMLALHTGRPVKMVYSREESFYGHVHRHPGRLRYEHGATRDGRLVYVRARLLLDGGPYTSSSPSVCLNAGSTAVGPYRCDDIDVESIVAFTNNPPCGAMRGFGAVQACFAHEAQMDRLAAALDLDPIELRRRNAVEVGSAVATGQQLEAPVPVRELLERLERLPPPAAAGGDGDLLLLPGGTSNTTHGEGVRRGVGYAVGFKNVGFSAGFDDYSTARVRVSAVHDQPLVEVHTSAAEVGQGGIVIHAQIARTELGVADVMVLPADTDVGDSGSTSASRQSWLTGGAVQAACIAVREELIRRAAGRLGEPEDEMRLVEGRVETASGLGIELVELVAADPAVAVREYRPRRTEPLGPDGQGHAHMAFSFAAHRAVVDVDVELGLARVVELVAVLDVGTMLNPLAVEGQIEGGTAQGLGLALMEEVKVNGGIVANPSFTDYLVPTILDVPRIDSEILELAQPDSPYGLNGMAEAPSISSTPAIVAALRAATGRPLTRVPVQPTDIVAAGAAIHDLGAA